MSLKDRACIVGIGETEYCRGEGSGMSLIGLQLKAALNAIQIAESLLGIVPKRKG